MLTFACSPSEADAAVVVVTGSARVMASTLRVVLLCTQARLLTTPALRIMIAEGMLMILLCV